MLYIQYIPTLVVGLMSVNIHRLERKSESEGYYRGWLIFFIEICASFEKKIEPEYNCRYVLKRAMNIML